MLKSVEFYYFSPTGGTKQVGENFCRGISETVSAINLGDRTTKAGTPDADLIVVAAPVFGGRIPAIVTDKLSRLNGKGKKAVTLAVYGNRAYEDALLELNRVLEAGGFEIAAAGACIAQHSMAPEVGKGRPDQQDMAEIREFAEKVLAKVQMPDASDDSSRNQVHVPGNFPYKDRAGAAVTPISLDTCSQCGECAAVCPTGAITIDRKDGVLTNLEQCILCMACVSACPGQARILPPQQRQKTEQKLAPFQSVRRENEFYL